MKATRLPNPAPYYATPLLVCVVTACFSGEGRLLEPGDNPAQPGGPEKTGHTLTVVTDSALAAALGWNDSAVAGVEVVLQRGRDVYQRDTAVTDKAGTIQFEKLLAGEYKLWARRKLTEAEQDAARGAGHEVLALGYGAKGILAAEMTIQLWSDQPGSLVISESYFPVNWTAGVGTYHFGGFIEFFNNSDTTVYLDGKIIAEAWHWNSEGTYSCAYFDHVRNDPSGIWAHMFQAFPGTGRDYPLAPGATVTVATDAIDHTQLVEGTLDFTDADFEFVGAADADNPSVPNMVDVGVESSLFEHGFFLRLSTPVFLAESVDLSALERDKPHPGNPREFVRFPADKILDVAAFRSGSYVSLYEECSEMVNRKFDRLEGHLHYGRDLLKSIHRRIAAVRSDGRMVLQRTKTTAVDFFVGPPSPGRVP